MAATSQLDAGGTIDLVGKPARGFFWRLGPLLKRGITLKVIFDDLLEDEVDWIATELRPGPKVAEERLLRATQAAALKWEEQRVRDSFEQQRCLVRQDLEKKLEEATITHKDFEDALKLKEAELDQECLEYLLRHVAPLEEWVRTGRLFQYLVDLSRIQRPLHEIVTDYKAHNPKEASVLQRSSTAIERWQQLSTSLCQSDASKFFREECRRLSNEGPRRLARYATPFQLHVPRAQPRCGSQQGDLGIHMKRCLAWLGCPAACDLVALCPTALAIARASRDHCPKCPGARVCDVCGFAVLPGPDQHVRLARHRAACGHQWATDGLFVRRFLVGEAEVPVCLLPRIVMAIVRDAEGEDFPGTDRSLLAPDAAVCCPHFNCDDVFCSRADALRHAASCTRRAVPSWSVGDLQRRLRIYRQKWGKQEEWPDDTCDWLEKLKRQRDIAYPEQERDEKRLW